MYVSMDLVGGDSNEESIVNDDEELCMVCLSKSSDFAPLMRPSSFFVSKCECRYLTHERCMTSWVRRQTGEQKPLLCPYCNSPVSLTVDYGMFLKPRDSCIDMPLIPDHQQRTNSICKIMCCSEKCWGLMGFSFGVCVLVLLLFLIS